MKETMMKGKPRGRNGGRKPGSKDKTPRNSRDLTEPLSLRVSASLMQRIMIAAEERGETVPDCVRRLLDEHL